MALLQNLYDSFSARLVAHRIEVRIACKRKVWPLQVMLVAIFLHV